MGTRIVVPTAGAEEGIKWRSNWASDVHYEKDDAVFRSGSSYVATQALFGEEHDPDNPECDHWDILALRADPITYSHSQMQPASEWVITHNLGVFPSVTVLDSTGEVVEGDISYVDSNTVILTFANPFGGSAHLN